MNALLPHSSIHTYYSFEFRIQNGNQHRSGEGETKDELWKKLNHMFHKPTFNYNYRANVLNGACDFSFSFSSIWFWISLVRLVFFFSFGAQ